MTNKELAKMLNISPSSLSLVLNNKPGVADATRQRILQQLEELGYSEHMQKKSRRSGNLCFMVYKKIPSLFVQYPFFLMLMEGMEDRVRELGSNLILLHVNGSEPIAPQLERLEEANVRGVILYAPELDASDLKQFEQIDRPFIYVDNSMPFMNVTAVFINNKMGARQAIDHLVELGHTSIGYLRSKIRIQNFEERGKYYREALQEHGLELRPEHIYTMRFSAPESTIDFGDILREHNPMPTAFVADDDTLAVGAHNALTEAGLHMPDDFAIVGFNNRAPCTVLSPQLTSVYAPMRFYGEIIIDALMRRINCEDEELNIKIMVNTRIAKRGSTLGAGSSIRGASGGASP